MPPFHATVLTLYPEMFPSLLGHSLAGRALEAGVWELEVINIRDFATDKHRTVDDTPYGGGAGMVLKPDVVGRAIESLDLSTRPCYYLSPRGIPLSQEFLKKHTNPESSAGIILLCGHFEGIDERVLQHYNIPELSIGDYVLSGGEVAAHVVLDSMVRLLPSVMGKQASHEQDSFSAGLLEHPHYTRPAVWQGLEVPAVLLSGNHGAVDAWRLQQAEDLTKRRRPDVWAAYKG
jgi:tRNA (guanine37-N1)-methyltransferase